MTTLPLSEVPEELLGAATVEIDRAAIREFVKRTGEPPAGARLVQTTRLAIR